MNILIACEESQVVTKEFRNKGHNAFSCDVKECTGERPEWHICSDVLPLLNGFCTFKTMDGVMHSISGKWDMIIAFPPCTHLAVSGARHFEKKRADGRQEEGIEFFCKFLVADCEKIVIENPINIISGEYVEKYFPLLSRKYNLPIKPTQRIQPWMFGDRVTKNTCLWIKGLEALNPLTLDKPEIEYVEWIGKNGKRKRQCKWYYDTFFKDSDERSTARSKTFVGIAKAMAEQWG